MLNQPNAPSSMKKVIKAIYGKEWTWFKSLTLGQQLRLLYFCVSFCIALIAATSDSIALIVGAVFNAAISLGMLGDIPIDKLEE